MTAPEPVLPASRQPVPVVGEGASADGEDDGSRRRNRSIKEIEDAIAERSERLSANVDELASRLKPTRVAREGVGRIGEKLTTPEGAPRLEVIGAAAGALLVAGFLIWRARRRRQ